MKNKQTNGSKVKTLARELDLARKALVRARMTGYGLTLALALYVDAQARYEAADPLA